MNRTHLSRLSDILQTLFFLLLCLLSVLSIFLGLFVLLVSTHCGKLVFAQRGEVVRILFCWAMSTTEDREIESRTQGRSSFVCHSYAQADTTILYYGLCSAGNSVYRMFADVVSMTPCPVLPLWFFFDHHCFLLRQIYSYL
jgi:hypothetical protein